jgi:Na+-driven multidrug efflux pump
VRANGAVVAPLIVLAISLLGIRFPMAMALLDRLHADAIWWSFPASSFIAVAMAIGYYKWGKWRTLRMITPQAAAAARAAAASAEIG